MLAMWGTIIVGLVDNIIYPILVGRQLDRLYPLDKDKDCVVRAVGDARPRAQAVIDAAGGQKPAK